MAGPAPSPQQRAVSQGLSRAIALLEGGEMESARQMMQQIYPLAPDNVDVLNAYACIMLEQGEPEVASGMLRKALVLAPGNAHTHNNIGLMHKNRGRPDEAAASFKQALAVDPAAIFALRNLCNLHIQQGKLQEAAPHLHTLLRLYPDDPFYWHAQAVYLYHHGRWEEAQRQLREAARRFPDDVPLQLAFALFLPNLSHSTQQLEAARDAFRSGVRGLQARAERESAFRLRQLPTEVNHFYLSYHARENKPLLAELARMYRTLYPQVNVTAPHCAAPRKGAGSVRVGIVSALMYDHSVGRCFAQVITLLAQAEGVEVVMFALLDEAKRDGVHRAAAGACGKVVYLSPLSPLEEAQRAIMAEEIDVLIYTDVAMAPLTYFLAYGRLAPVQMLLAGHPDSSGLDTIDYYIASAEIQQEGTQAHYTETLVRLPGWQVIMQPSPLSSGKSRAALGLPEGRLYACPMTLFKLHPAMDAIFAAILRRDPQGYVVLNADPHNTSLALQLQERFRACMPDVAPRILFLPWLSREDFMALAEHADVALDPPHFGAGTTAFYVLQAGTPMVTLPGQFDRTGTTASCYRKMGAGTECIARSEEEYVEIALRLAQDTPYRTAVAAAIKENAHRLFNDETGSRALVEFIRAQVGTRRG